MILRRFSRKLISKERSLGFVEYVNLEMRERERERLHIKLKSTVSPPLRVNVLSLFRKKLPGKHKVPEKG